MKLRSSLVIIAIGAILRWAVTATLSWIDLQMLGLIIMSVGLFFLLLALYRSMLSMSPWRRERFGPALVDISEPDTYRPDQPDPMLVGEIETAHHLAQEARTFLEAEGFSEQRIDELALAFAAKDIGRSTEEFIDWALAQGRLGKDPSLDDV